MTVLGVLVVTLLGHGASVRVIVGKGGLVPSAAAGGSALGWAGCPETIRLILVSVSLSLAGPMMLRAGR